jgi:hypothetical protein
MLQLPPFPPPLLKIYRLPFWKTFRLDNDLSQAQAGPATHDKPHI